MMAGGGGSAAQLSIIVHGCILKAHFCVMAEALVKQSLEEEMEELVWFLLTLHQTRSIWISHSDEFAWFFGLLEVELTKM